MQPQEPQKESNGVDDSNAKPVPQSITTKSQDNLQTSQKVLDVLSTEDLDGLIISRPELPVIQADFKLSRNEARTFAAHIVREAELDEEAYMPSSDEHLLKQTQGPLLAEIKRLSQDNIRLAEELEDADATTENTPEMIRQAMTKNTKLLLDIRKELSSNIESTGGPSVGLTVDVGSIFNEALDRARQADAEIIIQKEK